MGAAPTLSEPTASTRRRQARRAGTIMLLLLLAGAAGGVWKIEQARRAAEDARLRAETAEREMREQLRSALLQVSSATRLSKAAGKRQVALAAAEQAAKIRPELDARDEVIAALALPELYSVRQLETRAMKDGLVGIAANADRYAYEKALGKIEVRRLSDDGLLREFSGTTGKLRTHPTFSDDGAWLAVRNSANELLVWHEEKAEPLWKLTPRPQSQVENSPDLPQPDTFSPDGDLLASALPGSGVSIHRTDTGEEIARVTGPGEVTHVAFSPDGLQLAVARNQRGGAGAPGGFLRIVDAAKFTVVRELKLEGAFRSLCWSADAEKLLLAGERLEIYRTKDLKRSMSLAEPTAASAVFGASSNILVSSSATSGLTVWDVPAGRPLLTAPSQTASTLRTGQNGSWIVAADGHSGPSIHRLFLPEVVISTSLETAEQRTEFSAQGMSLDYSPDAKWLITAGAGQVVLRKGDSGKGVSTIPVGKAGQPVTVAFSTYSDRFYVSSPEAGLFRVGFKASPNGRLEVATPEPIDTEADFALCDVSDDGRRIVLVSAPKNEVKIIELGPPMNVIRWKYPTPVHAAFMNSGRSTLVNGAAHDGSHLLAVRNSSTADVEMPLPLADGSALRVSPDRRSVWISSGPDNAVVQRYGQLSFGYVLPAELKNPHVKVAFGHAAPLLAASEKGRIWLLDSETGTVLAHLPAFLGGQAIRGLEFSPDDAHLAVLWDNGTVSVWRMNRLRDELTRRGLNW